MLVLQNAILGKGKKTILLLCSNWCEYDHWMIGSHRISVVISFKKCTSETRWFGWVSSRVHFLHLQLYASWYTDNIVYNFFAIFQNFTKENNILPFLMGRNLKLCLSTHGKFDEYILFYLFWKCQEQQIFASFLTSFLKLRFGLLVHVQIKRMHHIFDI